MKYITKGYVVEAMLYTGNNGMQIENWSGDNVFESPALENGKPYLQIKTEHGTEVGFVSDYIIKLNNIYFAVSKELFSHLFVIISCKACLFKIEPPLGHVNCIECKGHNKFKLKDNV